VRLALAWLFCWTSHWGHFLMRRRVWSWVYITDRPLNSPWTHS